MVRLSGDEYSPKSRLKFLKLGDNTHKHMPILTNIFRPVALTVFGVIFYSLDDVSDVSLSLY